MELELNQIELRYEDLRKRDPHKERQLLVSLEELGQTYPVVVLAQPSGCPYVLLDGYKRLRGLKRLRQDTIQATLWELQEAEALLLERLMRTSQAESPLEQGWLLCALRERFGMSLDELGRRFDRTPSWISRRLALVRDLPEAIQNQVRAGRVAAHTAMKIMVPLARAKNGDCLQFFEILLKGDFSTREAGVLLNGWQRGDLLVKERIRTNPVLYLRVSAESTALSHDLESLSAMARKLLMRIGENPTWRVPAKLLRQTKSNCQALFSRLEELANA